MKRQQITQFYAGAEFKVQLGVNNIRKPVNITSNWCRNVRVG